MSAHARLSLGVTPALWRSGASHIRVGSVLTQSFHYVDEIGFFPWAAPVISLDLVARVALEVGPGLLRASAGLPVVGAVTRHIWSLNPVVPGRAPLVAFYQRGTRLLGVPGLRAPRLSATYGFGDGTWRPYLGLDVTGYRVVDPAPVRRLQTRILFGVTRTIGGPS